MLKLYSYFRSSSAYRVRLALNFKSISYEQAYIHLVKNGGEQFAAEYQQINPQAVVPSLEVDADILTQSLAIIEYLEEVYPEPALLPCDPIQRAKIRALAQIIISDIQPLDNLRVLKYLTNDLGVSEEQKLNWYQHWIDLGFQAFEKLIQKYSGDFCCGDEFSLADVVLIPQVYNALRFDCDLSEFTRIQAVYDNCLALDFVQAASPEKQHDFK